MTIKITCTQEEKDNNIVAWCHLVYDVFGVNVCRGDCDQCINDNIEWEIIDES